MKRKVKMNLARLLAGVVAVSTIPVPKTVHAASFSDISGHWAESTIQQLYNNNVVSGYEDGTILPNNPITRAEFVTIVNRAAGNTTRSNSANFSDVSSNAWYADQVDMAVSAGFIRGYEDGTFKPSNNISRQEAAVVMANALGLNGNPNDLSFIDNDNIASWAQPAVASVLQAGIIRGFEDNSFRPTQDITRAEAFTMVHNANFATPTQTGIGTGTQTSVTERQEAVTDSATTVVTAGQTFGNATEATEVYDLKITGGGATVQNVVVLGDLTITEEVADGRVNLDNVTVKGNTFIYGGGQNTITVNNSDLQRVVIKKEDNRVRLTLDGTTKVNHIAVQSGATVESNPTFTGKVNKIVVESGVNSGVRIETDVDNLELHTNITLTLANTKIGEFTLSRSAAGARVATSNTVEIGKAVINGASTFTGRGVILLADISVSGVRMDRLPNALASGSLSATSNSSSGSGSSGGSSGGGSGGGGGTNPTPTPPGPTDPIPTPVELDVTVGQEAPPVEVALGSEVKLAVVDAAGNPVQSTPSDWEARIGADTQRNNSRPFTDFTVENGVIIFTLNSNNSNPGDVLTFRGITPAVQGTVFTIDVAESAVPAPAPVRITLADGSAVPNTLQAGTTLQFTAIDPSNDALTGVVWSNSNQPAVGSIHSSTGAFTPTGAGTTEVTAQHANGTATTQAITITEAAITPPVNVPVTGITVSVDKATIGFDEKTQATALIEPSNATNKDVTWSIVESGVAATIDKDGLISAGSKAETITVKATSVSNPSILGTTTVEITEEQGALAAKITAKVKDGTENLDLTKPVKNIEDGLTINFTAMDISDNNITENLVWTVALKDPAVGVGTDVKFSSNENPTGRGVLTIPEAAYGTFVVTATDAITDKKQQMDLVVTPYGTQVLGTVVITNPPTDVIVNSRTQLTAEARDVNGVEIPNAVITWDVTGGTGASITSPGGNLTAGTEIGTLSVTASSTVDGVTEQSTPVSINVVPASPTTNIEITAAGVTEGSGIKNTENGLNIQFTAIDNTIMSPDSNDITDTIEWNAALTNTGGADGSGLRNGTVANDAVGFDDTTKGLLKIGKDVRGEVTVTAKSTDNVVTTFKFTVDAPTTQEVAVTDINVSVDKPNIKVGETAQASAVITPADATNKNVTWSIYDQGDATEARIDANGLITTGNIAGTIVVKGASVSDSTVYDTAEVIIAPATDGRITVTIPAANENHTKVTDTFKLDVEAKNTDGTAVTTPLNLEWKSSNSEIVSVTNDGTVTLLAPGKSTITATAPGYTTTGATITVDLLETFTVETTPTGADLVMPANGALDINLEAKNSNESTLLDITTDKLEWTVVTEGTTGTATIENYNTLRVTAPGIINVKATARGFSPVTTTLTVAAPAPAGNVLDGVIISPAGVQDVNRSVKTGERVKLAVITGAEGSEVPVATRADDWKVELKTVGSSATIDVKTDAEITVDANGILEFTVPTKFGASGTDLAVGDKIIFTAETGATDSKTTTVITLTVEDAPQGEQEFKITATNTANNTPITSGNSVPNVTDGLKIQFDTAAIVADGSGPTKAASDVPTSVTWSIKDPSVTGFQIDPSKGTLNLANGLIGGEVTVVATPKDDASGNFAPAKFILDVTAMKPVHTVFMGLGTTTPGTVVQSDNTVSVAASTTGATFAVYEADKTITTTTDGGRVTTDVNFDVRRESQALSEGNVKVDNGVLTLSGLNDGDVIKITPKVEGKSLSEITLTVGKDLANNVLDANITAAVGEGGGGQAVNDGVLVANTAEGLKIQFRATDNANANADITNSTYWAIAPEVKEPGAPSRTPSLAPIFSNNDGAGRGLLTIPQGTVDTFIVTASDNVDSSATGAKTKTFKLVVGEPVQAEGTIAISLPPGISSSTVKLDAPDFTLTAVASNASTPVESQPIFTWHSENTSVATVTNGLVSIEGVGSTKITASADGFTNGEMTITVTELGTFEITTDPAKDDDEVRVDLTTGTATINLIATDTDTDTGANILTYDDDNLVWSLVDNNSGAASISGNIITVTGTGIITVNASAKGFSTPGTPVTLRIVNSGASPDGLKILEELEAPEAN